MALKGTERKTKARFEMHKSIREKAPVSRLLFVRLNGAVGDVWLAVRELII